MMQHRLASETVSMSWTRPVPRPGNLLRHKDGPDTSSYGQESLAPHNWVAPQRVDKSGIQQALSQRTSPVVSALGCVRVWFC